MSCQVWFSNRRARLRKTAQSCSSPGYNPLALNMSGYSPASYMQVPPHSHTTDNLHSHNRNTPPTLQGSVGSLMESPDPAAYSSAMQGLSSYASNIMAAGGAGVGHTMNQYAATAAQQSSLLSSQVRVSYILCFAFYISNIYFPPDIAREQQHFQEQLQRRERHRDPASRPGRPRPRARGGRVRAVRDGGGGGGGRHDEPRLLVLLRARLLPPPAVPQLGHVRLVLGGHQNTALGARYCHL